MMTKIFIAFYYSQILLLNMKHHTKSEGYNRLRIYSWPNWTTLTDFPLMSSLRTHTHIYICSRRLPNKGLVWVFVWEGNSFSQDSHLKWRWSSMLGQLRLTLMQPYWQKIQSLLRSVLPMRRIFCPLFLKKRNAKCSSVPLANLADNFRLRKTCWAHECFSLLQLIVFFLVINE